MATEVLDQVKAEDFAQRMLDILNNGALALMISIGHRTGLFDVMARLSPSSSERIAVEAGLEERYVREWLGAMVTGGIIDYIVEDGTYHLSQEHAASMTRAAAADNIAAFAQYIPLLGCVEDQVVDCFYQGGGVPYSSYGRFQEVMSDDSGQSVVPALLSHILPLVSGLKERLTTGIDVLDVGCGYGRALILMAKAYPNSRFTGYDISEEGIAKGIAEAECEELINLRLEVKDVVKFDERAAYDLITAFDAIHDQVQPAKVLENIANALRPDGTFLMQDIAGSSYVHKNMDHPIGPFLYTISCMHCMTVSLAENGAGLGTMWGKEKAEEMLRAAGFNKIRIEQLNHDFQNYYYIATKG